MLLNKIQKWRQAQKVTSFLALCSIAFKSFECQKLLKNVGVKD